VLHGPVARDFARRRAPVHAALCLCRGSSAVPWRRWRVSRAALHSWSAAIAASLCRWGNKPLTRQQRRRVSSCAHLTLCRQCDVWQVQRPRLATQRFLRLMAHHCNHARASAPPPRAHCVGARPHRAEEPTGRNTGQIFLIEQPTRHLGLVTPGLGTHFQVSHMLRRLPCGCVQSEQV
jgi:hypothetical protein